MTKSPPNGVKISLPCYRCCEYCQNYSECATRNGCGKCYYNVYGECTHPAQPTIKQRAIVKQDHL